jgi:hypothetical protein
MVAGELCPCHWARLSCEFRVAKGESGLQCMVLLCERGIIPRVSEVFFWEGRGALIFEMEESDCLFSE